MSSKRPPSFPGVLEQPPPGALDAKPSRPRKVRSEYVRVPKYEGMRHYQSGREHTPWVKVHSRWLDDYKFCRLPDAQKLQVMLLWLVANRCGNLIRNDPEYLTWKLGTDHAVDVDQLVALGFLEPCEAGAQPEAPASEPEPPKRRPGRPKRSGPSPRELHQIEERAARDFARGPAADVPVIEEEEEAEELPAAAPTAGELLTRFRRDQPI